MNVANSNTTVDRHVDSTPGSDPHLYHCLCGKLVLILAKSLDNLPMREFDNSIVVDEKLSHKYYASEGKTIYIKRKNNLYELRHNIVCEKCKLTLFYRTNSSQPCIFVLKDSLKQQPQSTTKQHNSYNNKTITTRHTKEVGRYGFVTISTLDETEYNNLGIKDLSSSYSHNAQVIETHLKKKRPAASDMSEGEQNQHDGRIEFKKPRGTLDKN